MGESRGGVGMPLVDWKTVRSVAVGRIIGYVFAVILLAVATLFGLGPRSLAIWFVSGLGHWADPRWARYAFVLIAVLTIILLIRSIYVGAKSPILPLPNNDERIRIMNQLAMVKSAGTKVLDPHTISGIWAGTMNVDHTVRHLHFRGIKEAISQGKLPGTVLRNGKVNKYARVPIAALEQFWREIGVLGPAPVVANDGSSLVYLSLRDASGRLYGEVRGSFLAKFWERMSKSEDDILNVAGTTLVEHAPVEVRKPPSKKWESFDPRLLNQMNICGGASVIKYIGESGAFFVEPRILNSDLNKAIAEIKLLSENKR